MVTYRTIFLEAATKKYCVYDYTKSERDEDGNVYSVKSDTAQKSYVKKIEDHGNFCGCESGLFEYESGRQFLAIVEEDVTDYSRC